MTCSRAERSPLHRASHRSAGSRCRTTPTPIAASLPPALPVSFYDLYTPGSRSRTQCRRQPLPSAFLPRVIQGGTGAFSTNLTIWREAWAAPTTCPFAYSNNTVFPLAEETRFDEHENVRYYEPGQGFEGSGNRPGFPSTSTVSAGSSLFPDIYRFSDVAGWLYLNLNNGGSPAYSASRNYRFGTTRGIRQSQAWVVTSMYA